MIVEHIHSCDAMNFRKYLVDSEFSEVEKINNNKGQKTGHRQKVANREIKKMNALMDGPGRKQAIEEIAGKGRKFDIICALSVKCEYYEYVQYVRQWEDYNTIKSSSLTNMRDFYNKIFHMYNQFFQNSPGYATSLIDSDKQMEDKEGKKTSMMSSMAAVENQRRIVPEEDSVVRSNYKIYLEFLYTASYGLKLSSDIEAVIPEVLGYLWYTDTYQSYEAENNDNHSYFRVYVDRKDQIQRLKTKDINTALLKNARKKRIVSCIEDAIKKVNYKYSSELDDIDIGQNVFIFSRYVYRLLQICGVDIFKIYSRDVKEEGINYDALDIYKTILDESYEFSLKSVVPSYKFLPEFYEKTNSLNEWFTLTREDITNEYGLSNYSGFAISEPVKQLLNTDSLTDVIGNRNLVNENGYKTIDVETQKKELKEILILTHYDKLLGKTERANTYFRDMARRKLISISLLEGPTTLDYLNTKKKDFYVSVEYERILKEDTMINDRHPIYNVKGKDENDNVFSTDLMDRSFDITPEVKIKIEEMLTERILNQAAVYLNHYKKEKWNIPLAKATVEELGERIRLTKTVDSTTKNILLLGDPVEITIPMRTGGILQDRRFILRGDYKLIGTNIIYSPELVINEETGEEELIVELSLTNTDEI